MSNTPHRGAPEKQARSRPMLFVVILLVVIAGVLAFVAFHSTGASPSAQPATHATPAEAPPR